MTYARRRPTNAAKEAARARWMADFESHVTRSIPWHAGRLDWDSAAHAFNTGLRADEYANTYTQRVCAEHQAGDAS